VVTVRAVGAAGEGSSSVWAEAMGAKARIATRAIAAARYFFEATLINLLLQLDTNTPSFQDHR
jgi:hypothetical protein